MSFVLAGALTLSYAHPSLVLASAVARPLWSYSYIVGRGTHDLAPLDPDRLGAV